MIITNDCLLAMREMPDNSVDSIVTDPPYGLSFMGKKWDYDVPSKEIWQEALRVLKPGGHLLAFAGTRTQHRMAVNIEDAGFEIRDMIAWVYGSGFPKSLNIGKAVDKIQGNEREELGRIRRSGKEAGTYGVFEGNNLETKGTSEWEGWGTALKPALEPITLARKPLSEKNIALNCLKWGVGGMNIDGSRVAIDPSVDDPRLGGKGEWHIKREQSVDTVSLPPQTMGSSELGRFPANLIHDGSEEVLSLFPSEKDKSPARFFYCAKASKSERNKGLEGFEEKTGGGMAGTADQTLLTGSGNIRNNKMKNHHPTVKPVKLMQYLVRLITPPGGVVLDPFMGSGSTCIAAKIEGFEFIGIEMSEEYSAIAEARISAEKGTLVKPPNHPKVA